MLASLLTLVACSCASPKAPAPTTGPSPSPPPIAEGLTSPCPAPTPTAPPTSDLTRQATLAPARLFHYSSPTLGFAVDHPATWEVTTLAGYVDALAQPWSAIEFRSDLYGYGEQVFGRYVASVAVADSMGRSLTDTAEYGLSPIAPSMREGIEWTCCLEVGGEPAVELLLPWPMGGRWGSRQLVVIHDGREYRLTFYPLRTLDGATPSDAATRVAFDTFVCTFAFVPIAETATPPGSTVTPAATPSRHPPAVGSLRES